MFFLNKKLFNKVVNVVIGRRLAVTSLCLKIRRKKMARVKIEEIVYHLDNEFKKALSKTIDKYFPAHSYDINEVFREFKKIIYQ